MKKFFKTLFINILIIICLLFVLDIFTWGFENYIINKNNGNYIGIWPIPYHPGVKIFNPDFRYFPNPSNGWGRTPEGTKYSKKPIAIFGCSYAYGHYLKNEETFSYKLAHLAKRPVYNRAVVAWGVQHMLYQAQSPILYEQVPEPEYVMFVMMFDHLRRLYSRSFSSGHLLNEERYLRYKEFNGGLVPKKDVEVHSITGFIKNILDRAYLTGKIQQIYVEKYLIDDKNYDSYSKFMLKHFLQSREKMQEHWKNTKFVILMYDYFNSNDSDFRKLLEDNGFIVINLQELTQTDLNAKEYKLENDPHPNAKAWELITQKLIQKLNL